MAEALGCFKSRVVQPHVHSPIHVSTQFADAENTVGARIAMPAIERLELMIPVKTENRTP
jgi:hypothetical protein